MGDMDMGDMDMGDMDRTWTTWVTWTINRRSRSDMLLLLPPRFHLHGNTWTTCMGDVDDMDDMGDMADMDDMGDMHGR